MTSTQVRRRRARALGLAASAALVAALIPTLLTGTADAASAFTSTVVNQGNGNCMDVPGGASTSGLQLTQWSCNGGGNQSFTFTPPSGSSDTYTITAAATGNCVDISGGSSSDGAAIIQYACHGGTNQQFRLRAVAVAGATNTFNVVSASSGKCVAPAGDSPANNTALVQVACTAAGSRVWRLPGFAGGGPAPTTSPTAGPPAPGAVRVFWLRPTDVPYDQRYPDGIAAVMAESQRFFQQQLGKTFRLGNPVVVAVPGDHDTGWYINNNCSGDRYWCVVFNMQAELMRKYNLQDPARGGVIVGEVSAEEVGKSGGGGGGGWVLLSGHDADGAAGRGGDMKRWYGGMVHELGHAFGLPDSTSTDGTCMSASFYAYPNCVFSPAQKNGILNGPYGNTLS